MNKRYKSGSTSRAKSRKITRPPPKCGPGRKTKDRAKRQLGQIAR